mgnify:CR=1 FL=1
MGVLVQKDIRKFKKVQIFLDFMLCLEEYKRQQGSQSALSTSFKVDV